MTTRPPRTRPIAWAVVVLAAWPVAATAGPGSSQADRAAAGTPLVAHDAAAGVIDAPGRATTLRIVDIRGEWRIARL